jgi:hypothetical protein
LTIRLKSTTGILQVRKDETIADYRMYYAICLSLVWLPENEKQGVEDKGLVPGDLAGILERHVSYFSRG